MRPPQRAETRRPGTGTIRADLQQVLVFAAGRP